MRNSRGELQGFGLRTFAELPTTPKNSTTKPCRCCGSTSPASDFALKRDKKFRVQNHEPLLQTSALHHKSRTCPLNPTPHQDPKPRKSLEKDLALSSCSLNSKLPLKHSKCSENRVHGIQPLCCNCCPAVYQGKIAKPGLSGLPRH